jgi:hypothetical protein
LGLGLRVEHAQVEVVLGDAQEGWTKTALLVLWRFEALRVVSNGSETLINATILAVLKWFTYPLSIIQRT